MNDLISRDEALSFPFANGQYDHENANEHFIFGCETYREWLEQLPSAQPEIIRCKDCKWWTKQKDSLQGRCALFGMYPTGEWYCANAKMEVEHDN